MEGSAPQTVEDVVRAVVRTAAQEVETSAAAALADEPDGVHQHRVRVRRLRSVLAGFAGSLDAPSTERLRVAYAEWGRELGVVRDIEVRAEVAEAALERADVDDPEIVQRLVDSERERYRTAHARLVELSRSPRARARAELLREFAQDPPVVGGDDDDVPALLATVLRRQARRTRKAAKRLDGGDEAHHALRKAARRMRYVAEAIGEVAPDLFSEDVEALAEAGDQLHDALGGHRDAVILAEYVRREGVRAGRDGEPTEVYERIEDRLREEAAEHLAEIPSALRGLKAAASDLRRP